MADSDSVKSAADQTQDWTWLEERPLAEAGGDDEQKQLVDSILDWIRKEGGRRPGMKIAAIYGPRGSGKTSVMLEVLRRLPKEEQGYYLMPLAECGGHAEDRGSAPVPCFDPSASRDRDELPFDFLRFLERYEVSQQARGSRPNLTEHLKVARQQLARMADPERFLDLEKELVPSQARLPEQLAEARAALAQADEKVAKALGDWFKVLTGTLPAPQHKPLLILPIDDADLTPAFAFEVLELVRRHLRYVNGVVLLCADPDQLRRSVAVGLHQREQPEPEALAQPWLDKLIDVPFHLPVWGVERWWAWLREVKGQSEQRGAAVRQIEALFGPIEDESTDPAEDKATSATRTVLELGGSLDQQFARKLKAQPLWRDQVDSEGSWPFAARNWALGWLLPTTPRLAKALVRRLRVELRAAQATVWSEPKWLRTQYAWPIDHRATLAMMALVLAVDTSYPTLRLWEVIRKNISQFNEWMRHYSTVLPLELVVREDEVRPPDAADSSSGAPAEWRQGRTQSSSNTGRPELERVPEVHRIEAASVITVLGWVWRVEEERAARIVKGVLAVSLDADAGELAKQNWLDAEGRLEHVDLRGGRTQRPPVHEFRTLLDAAADQLAAVDGMYRGPRALDLVLGKVPATIALFLGWRLRFAAIRGVLNDFNGELTDFPLPGPRLEPREYSNGLGFFTSEGRDLPAGGPFTADAGRSAEQILTLDLNRRVSLQDLDTLPPQLRKLPARILRAKQMNRGYERQDFLPVLQDMLDHIAWMRREEGVRTFHLIFVGPISFAFALGRQLHSQGIFHLYEWERATQRYQYALSFPDEVAPPDLAPAEPAPEPAPSAAP